MKDRTKKTTEHLLAAWYELVDAAFAYQEEETYEHGQSLRTAAREYGLIADALERKS